MEVALLVALSVALATAVWLEARRRERERRSWAARLQQYARFVCALEERHGKPNRPRDHLPR